jgi:hypothetical protein
MQKGFRNSTFYRETSTKFQTEILRIGKRAAEPLNKKIYKKADCR